MKKLGLLFAVITGIVIFLAPPIGAGDSCSKEEVSKAVEAASAILEADGEAGLEKVGKMQFCSGNYLFVNDLKGKTLMHIKPHLIGKVLISLKDDKGKRFFAEFTKTAKSAQGSKNGTTYYNGSGWVKYRWPKPGEKAFSPKVSYIKGCLMGKTNVYVGAGYYE
jgi:signal transduction histidine kinase